MKYISRKPQFEVIIERPAFDSQSYRVLSPTIRFISSFAQSYTSKEIVSGELISYSFSESLNSIESNFSLVLPPSVDNDGRSWLDKIEVRDIVYIYEFGELRYVGYVETRRYSAQISPDGKPNRRVLINGGGIGKLLSTFNLILNQAFYQATTIADAAAQKLSAKLASEMAENAQIGPILKSIYEDYMDLVIKIGTTSASIGVKQIIDNFIDIDSGLSNELVAIYPVSLSLYQVGENNIWQIWSQLLFPPVNELFGRWNPESQKYEMIFRKTPFDPSDWKALPLTSIPPIIITEHDIGSSDSEVYTFYLGMLPGSGISQNLAILSVNPAGKNYVIDEEKWTKYGYRPMIIQFRYFDRSKQEAFQGASKLMRDVSEMLKTWFKHNDEYFSGSITIMTADKDKVLNRNPRIGEKISILEGEFYIESCEHTWSFAGPMQTKITISRGAVYGSDGSFESPISKIGTKVQALSMKGQWSED